MSKSKPMHRLVRQNRFSISLILPKAICKQLGLNPGNYVTCKLNKNKIIIEKLKQDCVIQTNKLIAERIEQS
jgi:antitoxin component of MazEF toxin-antitoxin module